MSELENRVAAMRHMVQAIAITQGEHGEYIRRIEETQVRQISMLEQIIGMLGES